MRSRNKIKIICSSCLLAVLSNGLLYAQQLVIIEKNRTYYQQVQADSLQRMVELRSLIPDIRYDLRYATSNNFMHRRLYKEDGLTFLRIKPAMALASVQRELVQQGYGLKIFDAYRPYSITKKMWVLIHDDRYVADPAKGSGHNRGISVDLTIVDKDGHELPMGTGFDNFTDSAHQDFQQLPDVVLANRRLLRNTMMRYGFKPLSTEWWHYTWNDDHVYNVLDIDFRALNKIGIKKGKDL